MQQNDDRKLVSIDDACELTGVSRRSMYNWLRLGKVDAVRTAGGNVRIYRDSLFKPLTQTQTKKEK